MKSMNLSTLQHLFRTCVSFEEMQANKSFAGAAYKERLHKIAFVQRRAVRYADRSATSWLLCIHEHPLPGTFLSLPLQPSFYPNTRTMPPLQDSISYAPNPLFPSPPLFRCSHLSTPIYALRHPCSTAYLMSQPLSFPLPPIPQSTFSLLLPFPAAASLPG